MQQIVDFHIHSKYSRACSPNLTLENIDKTCRTKGIDIIGTGDFTYPKWFQNIKDELEEIENVPLHPFGYKSKGDTGGLRNNDIITDTKKIPLTPFTERGLKRGSGLYKLKIAVDDKVKFILTTELALVYKKGGKARRIHVVVHAPNIEAAEDLNKQLDKNYNIRSDGRPILGMSAEDLCQLCFSIHPKFIIYPAHIWTPWFGILGSKSGFERIEECFGKFTKQIYAYETGLSSDPAMNWRVSQLDKLTLLSNSDAHSLENIGREANVFELKEISYNSVYEVIKGNKKAGKILRTIEFYPEEGIYHYDGHRDCKISFPPPESKKNKNICPVCKQPLTIGVLNRVEALADRPEGFILPNTSNYKKLVGLDKIIADSMSIKSRKSKKVIFKYNEMIKKFGSELNILIDLNLDILKNSDDKLIIEGIRRVRAGEIKIIPGFDGQYGRIKIYK